MAPAEEVAAAVAVVVEAVAMGDQAMGPDQGMVRAVAVEVLLVGMDMVVAKEAVAARVVELVALGIAPGKGLATELAVVVLVGMGVEVEVVVAKVVVRAMAMEAVKATALALAMVVVVLLVVAVLVVDKVAVVAAAKVDLATALARVMGQVKDMEQVVLMEEAMEAVVAVAVVKVVALAMDLDPALALVMEVATATGTIRLFLRARYISILLQICHQT